VTDPVAVGRVRTPWPCRLRGCMLSLKLSLTRPLRPTVRHLGNGNGNGLGLGGERYDWSPGTPERPSAMKRWMNVLRFLNCR
jgi:hypothetical protein